MKLESELGTRQVKRLDLLSIVIGCLNNWNMLCSIVTKLYTSAQFLNSTRETNVFIKMHRFIETLMRANISTWRWLLICKCAEFSISISVSFTFYIFHIRFPSFWQFKTTEEEEKQQMIINIVNNSARTRMIKVF